MENNQNNQLGIPENEQKHKPFIRRIWVRIVISILAVMVGCTAGFIIISEVNTNQLQNEKKEMKMSTDIEVAKLHKELWKGSIPKIDLNKVIVIDNQEFSIEIIIESVEIVSASTENKDSKNIRVTAVLENIGDKECYIAEGYEISVFNEMGFQLESIYTPESNTYVKLQAKESGKLILFYKYSENMNSISIELSDIRQPYAAGIFMLKKEVEEDAGI